MTLWTSAICGEALCRRFCTWIGRQKGDRGYCDAVASRARALNSLHAQAACAWRRPIRGMEAIAERPDGDGQFALTWMERGGPRVDEQGDGEGFGALLARATVNGRLGGEISRDWKAEGLIIRLSVAGDRITAE
jgi:hypothetical protein